MRTRRTIVTAAVAGFTFAASAAFITPSTGAVGTHTGTWVTCTAGSFTMRDTGGADTYIDSSTHVNNFGGNATASIGGSANDQTLIRFADPGALLPAGCHPTSETLAITGACSCSVAMTAGIRPINGSWTETGVTWDSFAANNSTGTQMGTIVVPASGNVNTSTSLTTSLTAAWTNGLLLIKTAGSATEVRSLKTKENSGGVGVRPLLTVTYGP